MSGENPLLIALGGVFVLAIWVAIVMRWRRGIWGLLLYMPFGGAIALLMHPSKLPLLFKDLFFVLPAYIAFFVFHLRDLRKAPIPPGVLVAIGILAAIVLLQAANPGVLHWMVAAIGVKVWLFYIPLMFLAAAMIESQEQLVKLLRVLVVIAIVPCVIGLFQWFGSATIGYQETIGAFYGDAAANATQGFAQFDYGGAYYRIPSTFTFTSQYFGYTMAMIVFAYALHRLDTDPMWRRFALLMVGVFIVSSVLSGARGAVVFIPFLLMLTVVLDRRVVGMLSGIVLAPVMVITALYLGGVDPMEIFFTTRRLVGHYSKDLVYQSVIDAIVNHPLGIGTGMNTGPARHAFTDRVLVFLESYYAKAIVELGILGGLAALGMFIALILSGWRTLRSLRHPGLKGCAAAIVAFYVTIAIHSGKGWQIDYDPVNVYFWIFAGILFKLRRLEPQYAPARRWAPGMGPFRPRPGQPLPPRTPPVPPGPVPAPQGQARHLKVVK